MQNQLDLHLPSGQGLLSRRPRGLDYTSIGGPKRRRFKPLAPGTIPRFRQGAEGAPSLLRAADFMLLGSFWIF